jgi:hypothetical protein
MLWSCMRARIVPRHGGLGQQIGARAELAEPTTPILAQAQIQRSAPSPAAIRGVPGQRRARDHGPRVHRRTTDGGLLRYKSVAGQQYYGRGPLQISWNYNYGAAALGQNLLANPGLVSSDATISWETALWFWMTSTPQGWTAHTIMVQGAGFGLTIEVINGWVECNGGNPSAVNERGQYYQTFCALLGVPTGANLTC